MIGLMHSAFYLLVIILQHKIMLCLLSERMVVSKPNRMSPHKSDRFTEDFMRRKPPYCSQRYDEDVLLLLKDELQSKE
jgi:hypothetical protein